MPAGHEQEFVKCKDCSHVFERPQGRGPPVACPACGVWGRQRKSSAWGWCECDIGSALAAEDKALASDPLPFGGRVLWFQRTEKGAHILFGDTNPTEVYRLVGKFLTLNEFGRESRAVGRSTWGRGSGVGRALVGGLVSRAEYVLTITETTQGVSAVLESAMSGWGGSVLGVAREHSQRKTLIQGLEAFIASLSIAPPTIAAPTIAAPTQQATGPETDDPSAALVRLRDLRDRDLITEEEYAAKRAEIISRL